MGALRLGLLFVVLLVSHHSIAVSESVTSARRDLAGNPLSHAQALKVAKDIAALREAIESRVSDASLVDDESESLHLARHHQMLRGMEKEMSSSSSRRSSSKSRGAKQQSALGVDAKFLNPRDYIPDFIESMWDDPSQLSDHVYDLSKMAAETAANANPFRLPSGVPHFVGDALKLSYCLHSALTESSGEARWLSKQILDALKNPAQAQIAAMTYMVRLLKRLGKQQMHLVKSDLILNVQNMLASRGAGTIAFTKVIDQFILRMRSFARYDPSLKCVVEFLEKQLSKFRSRLEIAVKALTKWFTDFMMKDGLPLAINVGVNMGVNKLADALFSGKINSMHRELHALVYYKLFDPEYYEGLATDMKGVTAALNSPSALRAAVTKAKTTLAKPWQPRDYYQFMGPMVKAAWKVATSPVVEPFLHATYDVIAEIVKTAPRVFFVAFEVVGALGDVFTEWIPSFIDRALDYVMGFVQAGLRSAFVALMHSAFTALSHMAIDKLLLLRHEHRDTRVEQWVASQISPEAKAKMDRAVRFLFEGIVRGRGPAKDWAGRTLDSLEVIKAETAKVLDRCAR